MSMINKMLNLIGFETAEDDFDDELLEGNDFASNVASDADESETLDSGKRGKVVKIHTTAQLKLVVMQPETFEDARDIANHLKSKKPVVMWMGISGDILEIVSFLFGFLPFLLNQKE